MSMILDGTNGVTFNDSSLQGAAASPYGLKNRIINGDMRIDQRNAGASVTPTNNQYSVDRWANEVTQTSKFTVQQSSTAPVGFSKSLKITSSSSYSAVSSDVFDLKHQIEGYNIADFSWGTANAKTVTLSFWVYSSLTGTFGGSITNDGSYSYPFSYTISSANTWEQKTVTIIGSTSGTWDSTNGTGLYLRFNLGCGSNYLGTANAWVASNIVAPTGSTSVVGTNGATWYITGVQLEVGSTATPFERRLYGTELDLCKRYYQTYSDYDGVGVGKDTTAAFFSYQLRPSMRTSPTCTFTCTHVDKFGTAYTATTGAAVLDARPNQVTTYATVTMTGRGEPCGPSGSLLTINAEL